MCCAIGAMLVGLAALWRRLALGAAAVRWTALASGVVLLAASGAAMAAGPAGRPLAGLALHICGLR